MQKSVPWWAYLASFLLNCFFLLLFFTSFKFNFCSKKIPEKVHVRLASKPRSILKPKLQTKNKAANRIESKLTQSHVIKSKPKVTTKLKKKNKPKTMLKAQSKHKTNLKPKTRPKPAVKPGSRSKSRANLKKKSTIKSIRPKSQTKKKTQTKLPVITSTEEKLLSEKLKSLEKEKKERKKREKELASLRKKIISSYEAEEAKKNAELKKVEEEYKQNAIALIKQILQENFVLPVYLKEKQGLFAIVSLDVDVKGNINYHFLKLASNEEFNQAVEECLKLSSPLPVEGPLHLVVKFKALGLEAL